MNLISQHGFLEGLIDACVMECYFREHMAESDLLFQETVAQTFLSAILPPTSEALTVEGIQTLVTRLQATDLPQKLKTISEKSPNLLGVILKEGKV
jgi:hypothetical protein